MTDIDTFRTETRVWLEGNCPAEMREPVRTEKDAYWAGRRAQPKPGQQEWLDAMASRGWTVPDWPKAYGGGGLSPAETKVLREEMSAIGARDPLHSFGISMLGPALLRYGTEEQKLEHLPPIARGEIRWCQGYSEPNAGSDLASLATSAVSDGDDYVLNGQKVWTSYAEHADWIFCLVRTSRESKQGGISFLLFDMTTPGIAIKPILLISGGSPFCETFFDDVRVPKKNRVGDENKGWDVAKYLLGHEREMNSVMGGSFYGGDPLVDGAIATVGLDAAGRLADPVLRTQLATYEVRSQAFAAMYERFLDELKAGSSHSAKPSMMKYWGTELNKARLELVVAAGGSDALEWESERSGHGRAARAWLRTKANSIEGGTSEIQLNIVAKRILELPS